MDSRHSRNPLSHPEPQQIAHDSAELKGVSSPSLELFKPKMANHFGGMSLGEMEQDERQSLGIVDSTEIGYGFFSLISHHTC